jgi:hypothetical protein
MRLRSPRKSRSEVPGQSCRALPGPETVKTGHKETWRASTQNDVIYLIETIEQHREMRRSDQRDCGLVISRTGTSTARGSW